MTPGDGNGWVDCALGHRHWGRFGAAGLLLRRAAPVDAAAGARGGPGSAPDGGAPDVGAGGVQGRDVQVLLQHRAPWTAHGDTWGLVGGARDSAESAVDAALREALEEAGLPAGVVRVVDEWVDDHGDWSYVTVVAELDGPFTPVANDESLELRWVAEAGVDRLDLHPGFARTWPQLRRP